MLSENSTLEYLRYVSLIVVSEWVWFGLLGVNASATARVISRRWNDDDENQLSGEEYPEETTDQRQVSDETFHTYGLCPVRPVSEWSSES